MERHSHMDLVKMDIYPGYLARMVGFFHGPGGRFLVFLASFFSGFPVHAVDFVNILSDREAVTVGMLRESYDYHLDAAGRMVSTHTERMLTSADLDRLAHRWSTATVARFEYTYVRHGKTTTVVYHAISGREANQILDIPIADMSTFYGTGGASRPALIGPAKGSRLAVPEAGHIIDAEVKAVRTIEEGILAGELPQGGRLRAWVSQPVCSSCKGVISSFETAYGVRTTINQWGISDELVADSPFRQLSNHRRRGSSRLRQWRRSADRVQDPRRILSGCLP